MTTMTLSTPTFKPAWWLPGAHLQTMFPSLCRRAQPLPLVPWRLECPDGDFIDCVWDARSVNDAHKPVVMILHGLGGCIESAYAKGLMQAVYGAGARGVFVHFRGCSGEPNRLARNYHAADTVDCAFVAESIIKQHAPVQIAAIGVSLGANVLLKWLGETGNQNPLDYAIAISVPFDLAKVSTHLQTGIARIYQRYLLTKLIKQVSLKTSRDDFPLNLQSLKAIKTIWDFDDKITAPLHGFKNATDYYQTASCKHYLKNIKKPTTIIHAKNDPFMPSDILPTPDMLSQTTALNLQQQGGHVGFVSRGPNYWLDQITTHHLKTSLSVSDTQELLQNHKNQMLTPS